MSLLNKSNATAQPLLDDRDIILIAHRISSPLHHCCGRSQPCGFGKPCDMCFNAARLVMQEIIPMVANEMLGKIHTTFGFRCPPWPGGDD